MDWRPISADSHITEPPTCYVDHIDPAFRERAPRIVSVDKLGDTFVVEGMKTPVPLGLIAAAGVDPAKCSTKTYHRKRPTWLKKAARGVEDLRIPIHSTGRIVTAITLPLPAMAAGTAARAAPARAPNPWRAAAAKDGARARNGYWSARG